MTNYAKHGTWDYASRTAKGCEEAGEPVFLLRAQDVTAPDVVRFWARQLQNSWVRKEALRIADEMERWPHRKEPD